MNDLQELLDRFKSGTLTQAEVDSIPYETRVELAKQAVELRETARKEEQIRYYRPASESAKKIHYSQAKQQLNHGGNRSAKTTTVLADMIICATKIIPQSLPNYPVEKIQCPMRFRITCQSDKTWETVIKPKLQWDVWNGKGKPGTGRGHWGLIPRAFLLKGKWDESWSAQYKQLTLTCGCTIQIMSYTQDVEEFRGASFHVILHDEGPPQDIYEENRIRTLDTSGRCIISFTPPDDESESWDAAWIFDEIYEKGIRGEDPQIEVVQLLTEDNFVNDLADIEEVTKGLSPAQKEVRTKGAFMHLTGRIYGNYTDRPQWWCFHCASIAILGRGEGVDGHRNHCATCGSQEVCKFCHFVDVDTRFYHYPIVYILDPHPRKANMMTWIATDPNDDYTVVAELDHPGEPAEVRDAVFKLERDYGFNIAARLIDPNMAESPGHNAGRRDVSVRDEYDAVGLRCALAVDSFNVGQKRLKELLKPDPRTHRPRWHVFNTCVKSNRQVLRYVWKEHATQATKQNKDSPGIPRDKDDDYPTMWKYFVNANYTYNGLRHGGQPMVASKRKRTGTYA